MKVPTNKLKELIGGMKDKPAIFKLLWEKAKSNPEVSIPLLLTSAVASKMALGKVPSQEENLQSQWEQLQYNRMYQPYLNKTSNYGGHLTHAITNEWGMLLKHIRQLYGITQGINPKDIKSNMYVEIDPEYKNKVRKDLSNLVRDVDRKQTLL